MQKIGPYTVTELIGEGGTSSVWKGFHTVSNLAVAIKIISKEYLKSETKVTRFTREIELLKSMEHPLIVDFYQHIEDEKNHYLIMEYLPNGSLDKYIKDNGPLSEQTTMKYFVQLFSVLSYLHKTVHIMHRDLKAENILLDSNYNIRIIDFGLSKQFEDESSVFRTLCGTSCMYFLHFIMILSFLLISCESTTKYQLIAFLLIQILFNDNKEM